MRPHIQTRSGASRELFGSAALLAAALIWGSSYVIVKDLLINVSPPLYITLRFMLAVPLVAVLFRQSLASWWRSAYQHPTRGLLPHVVPGLFLAAAFLSQTYGLRETSPGTAAFLTSLVFLFVPLYEIASGERMNAAVFLVPLLCATVGTVLLTGAVHVRFSRGDTLLLICAAAYAGQIYFSGRLVHRAHFSVLFVTQGTLVLIGFLIYLGFAEPLAATRLNELDVLRIVYVATMATALCYLLQFWAQRFVRAHYVGLIYAAEPVAAMALSASLGYEILTVEALIGALLISLAVLLAIRASTIDPETESRGGG